MLVGAYKTLSKEKAKVEQELGGAITDEDKIKFLQDKLELIDEVIEYVKSFCWLKRKTTIEKVKFFIECGYDYELLCREFDITDTMARNTISWSYRKLREHIGENTISLIKQDRIADAWASFYMATGKVTVNDFLMEDLIKILPREKFYGGISLAECYSELLFMQSFSSYRLERLYKHSDDKRLAYLLHLLSGSSKKADLYRKYMIAVLQGRMTVEEIIKAEEDIRHEQCYI